MFPVLEWQIVPKLGVKRQLAHGAARSHATCEEFLSGVWTVDLRYGGSIQHLSSNIENLLGRNKQSYEATKVTL